VRGASKSLVPLGEENACQDRAVDARRASANYSRPAGAGGVELPDGAGLRPED